MKKRTIFLLLLLCLPLIATGDITPQTNLDFKNVYSLVGVDNITARVYCQLNGTCGNVTRFLEDEDTNFSTICSDGEIGLGEGACKDFNDSIDERTASTTYLPWNITTLEGTHTQGNLTSILTPEDGDSYNVSVDVGANPLLIEVNFTGVSTFDSVIGRVYFEDTEEHRIGLYIPRVDTGELELYLEFLATGGFVNFYVPVYDPEDHINETNVSIVLDHIQSGTPNHYFRIDYIALVEGWTAMTNADLGSLDGRGDYTLLPWAMPTNGSLRNFTGDVYTDGIFYGGWNNSGLYYLKTIIDALLLDINDTKMNITDQRYNGTNGTGITFDNNQYNHSDTSSQSSSDNSGRNFIQDIILDTFGHITSIVVAELTNVLNDTTLFGGHISGAYSEITVNNTIGLSASNTTSGEFADARISASSVRQHLNDTDYRINKINVTEQANFMENVTIEQGKKQCYNGTTCEVWTLWNGSCLISHTPAGEVKVGSAC